MQQLRNPTAIMATEQAAIIAEQQIATAEVEKQVMETLLGFKRQHQEYEQHVLSKITEFESNIIRHKGLSLRTCFKIYGNTCYKTNIK